MSNNTVLVQRIDDVKIEHTEVLFTVWVKARTTWGPRTRGWRP
jgi:hypothetical protein